MAKRKRTEASVQKEAVPVPQGTSLHNEKRKPRSKRAVLTNPDINKEILDGQDALRASPSAAEKDETFKGPGTSNAKQEVKSENIKVENEIEAEDQEESLEEIQAALSRPPPVHSDYLPLPWKGRLGYACLNTYLRYSNPPVFSSRTCRIASILEHRHPLKDPNAPHHATKNRPDLDQPSDIARGQKYVESLGLANAKDIVKMIRWNDKYGIKFLRLSSEMFPFASHEEYGYSLAPFASETLAEAGRVAAELGHRLTTHPGQFTQLGSPRKEVIKASIRDLKFHSELLSLLKLPPQQNRDAVMILHMGGVFGDKAATLDRFRENYKGLTQDIKNRLVLENDDVSWTVHDLLPICQELNIPLVLDYHHHNIMFDSDKMREGTRDIMTLYDEIRATWTRKGIRQKMHYSEPTPAAITGRQRRKHSPRVATLPPCAPDMDLMIEAKDKEQAVFELMRTFKLPGWDTFNDMIPHVRVDEKRPAKRDEKERTNTIPDEEVGMGGPDCRVYWPPTMEEWLRPAKRIVSKKTENKTASKADIPTKTTKSTTKRKSAQAVPTPSVSDQESFTDIATSPKAIPKEKAKKAENPGRSQGSRSRKRLSRD